MKRLFFICGIILLAVAFLITGAELATRVLLGSSAQEATFFISIWEVWYTIAPQSFLAAQDSALLTTFRPALNLPGWLVFGLPGLILAALFRNREADTLNGDEFREHEQSLYLYDELAQAAEDEGLSDLPDDLSPSNSDDIIPAEAHYADDPVDDDLLPDRDYLLGGGPAGRNAKP